MKTARRVRAFGVGDRVKLDGCDVFDVCTVVALYEDSAYGCESDDGYRFVAYEHELTAAETAKCAQQEAPRRIQN